MDRLTRDAIIADNMGMSYGKMMALRHEGLIPEPPEDAPDPAPIGKDRKLYCSWDCEHAVTNARARDTYRRRKHS